MTIQEIKADIAANGVPFCLKPNVTFALPNTTDKQMIVSVMASDGTGVELPMQPGQVASITTRDVPPKVRLRFVGEFKR